MIKFNDYIEERLAKNTKLKKTFWDGYEKFKIGVILKEARIESGLSQEELAKKIHTTKSVISRIENHAEDIKLSTLEKCANALGKQLELKIA